MYYIKTPSILAWKLTQCHFKIHSKEKEQNILLASKKLRNSLTPLNEFYKYEKKQSIVDVGLGISWLNVISPCKTFIITKLFSYTQYIIVIVLLLSNDKTFMFFQFISIFNACINTNTLLFSFFLESHYSCFREVQQYIFDMFIVERLMCWFLGRDYWSLFEF